MWPDIHQLIWSEHEPDSVMAAPLLCNLHAADVHEVA